MKMSEKVLIGGIGALMPIFLNLLVVDFDGLQSSSFRPPVVLGYVVRVTVLFGLGGLVAYLHKSEKQAFKLFQLGLGAPALLLGMLNGFNAQHPADQHTTQVPANQKIEATHSWLPWEPSAEAQEASSQPPTKDFNADKPSALDEFWQGFTGRHPDRVWYVISGSHLTAQAAQKQADEINRSGKGLSAEVYTPFGESKYYAVVIGAGLSKSEARIVQQKALQAGLPKSTFLWTFPRE